MAFFDKSGADGIAPSILPHEGMVQRFAGGSIKNQDGFALISNAQILERRNFFGVAADNFLNDRQDVLPDFFGIVFDPAGLGINLPVRAGGLVQHMALRIEENRLRGGRALINGQAHVHAILKG
jgi:hypothetical protein